MLKNSIQAILHSKSTNKKLTCSMLGMIALISYFSHFFLLSVSTKLYVVFFAFFVFFYIISKPILLHINYLLVSVCLSSVCVLESYLRSSRDKTALIDVIFLLIGFCFIIFYSRRISDYWITMTVISALSIFFAFTVIIQFVFPSAYYVLLAILPYSFSSVVRSNISGEAMGLTTNPGFSAGYVISGLIVCFSHYQSGKKLSRGFFFQIAVLSLALLLTGKRGPTLFMALTLALVYLVPQKGSKKIKRLWVLFGIAMLMVILYLIFYNQLIRIPIIQQISNTVNGIANGDDVSSKRGDLSRWALKLFFNHPLTGIGWGSFRTTVVGTVTSNKMLDTHNIYLQLLCETGIIGFLCVGSTLFLFWNLTRKMFIECYRSSTDALIGVRPFMFFSFAYQTYFLLYGLTGNPLYDQHYQIIYFIACSIALAYKYGYRQHHFVQVMRKVLA